MLVVDIRGSSPVLNREDWESSSYWSIEYRVFDLNEDQYSMLDSQYQTEYELIPDKP